MDLDLNEAIKEDAKLQEERPNYRRQTDETE